ncbi:MAG TPA: NIPSNAP family protein [Trueperaceae bacterium]
MLYELRTYHAAPGRMADLHDRFQRHTLQFFHKHRIEVVGFWTNEDESALIYLVRFPGEAERAEAWEAFKADPEWQEIKRRTEADGPLFRSQESVLLRPTSYSPLR